MEVRALWTVFREWDAIQMWRPARGDMARLAQLPGLLAAHFETSDEEPGWAGRILVHALMNQYLHIRQVAFDCLKAIYWVDNGYRPDAPKKERQEMASVWRKFIGERSRC